MSAISALPHRPGILIISHDPSVVAHADVVYRLHDGRLHNETVAQSAALAQASGA